MRLKKDDVIHFQGLNIANGLRVFVIEYVNINSLTGTWHNASWDFFYFAANQEFSIQAPFEKESKIVYDFIISPGTGDFWTILISSKNENKVGQIRVSKENTRLDIFSSGNTEVQEHFDLTRVH